MLFVLLVLSLLIKVLIIQKFIYILALLVSFGGFAQNYADKSYYLVDSLDLSDIGKSDRKIIEFNLEQFHDATNDTSKINALNDICENMVHRDWKKYLKLQLALIEKALDSPHSSKENLALKKSLASAFNNTGYSYSEEGNSDLALHYYRKGLQLNKEIRDKSGMADCYHNIALLYEKLGNIELAIENYNRSLEIYEELGNTKGMIASYNGVGVIHRTHGNNELALEYYKKSLKISKESDDKRGIALSYTNIGACHKSTNNSVLALDFLEKAVKIYEDLQYEKGMAITYNSIGDIHRAQGDIELALEYYKKSLKKFSEIEQKSGMATTYHNLALIAFDKGNWNGPEGALILATKSFDLSQEVGYPRNIEGAAKLLYRIYAKQGNFKKALKMRNLQIEMRDRLAREENIKAVSYKKAQYEFEKQKAIDNKEHEKQLAVQKEEKEKQRIILYTATGGSILIILFISIYFGMKKKKNKVKRQLLETEKIRLNTQLKLAKKEQEFLQLKAEAESKNVQFLSHELLSKQNFAENLIEKLDQFNNISKPELKSIEQFIQNELDIKSTRAQLQNQMGDLSSSFYNKLKIDHPSLTDIELKLAAMIVMQMSNKEIAISKNMTSETVRNAKYRLKKKLKLSSNEDLFETLSGYLS